MQREVAAVRAAPLQWGEGGGLAGYGGERGRAANCSGSTRKLLDYHLLLVVVYVVVFQVHVVDFVKIRPFEESLH